VYTRISTAIRGVVLENEKETNFVCLLVECEIHFEANISIKENEIDYKIYHDCKFGINEKYTKMGRKISTGNIRGKIAIIN
jgi:hypothetical protein